MTISPIRDLWVGRLGLVSVEAGIAEQLGSPITTAGDTTAVGERRVKGFTLVFPIHGSTGDADPYYTGQRMRRQLRSLMQNTPYRLAGLYIQYRFDPERDGWVVMATGNLADADGGVTLAEYQLTLDQAFLIAQRHTHREGLRASLADMRLTTASLDYLGQVIGGGFFSLPALPVVPLPIGASDVAALGSPVLLGSRPSAEGAIPLALGRSDGDILSWERPEAAMNLGDVVAYDRRGHLGPFGGGGSYDVSPYPADVQSAYGWEEVYGPDYPYNWLTAGQPADAPVLANGLCRCRYDSTNGIPGFVLDMWTAGTWAEQGKVMFARYDGSFGGGGWSNEDTWVSASIVEYTPDRAVIQLGLRASLDALSREVVYVTLQRGWHGPRFEVYSAPGGDGTISSVGAAIYFAAAAADANGSVYTLDGGQVAMAAAVNSATFGAAPLGTGTFSTSENWVAFMRPGAQITMVPGAPTHGKSVLTNSAAYGANRNSVEIFTTGGGWASVRFALVPTITNQVVEAEAIRNASATTGQVADAAASAGQTVEESQTSPANPTLLASTAMGGAKFRVSLRVRVDPGATGNYQVLLGSATTATGSTSSTSYTDMDLGEITAPGATPTLKVVAWNTTPHVMGFLAAPASPTASASPTGGSMHGGTWFYRVTAINASGETTGSAEVSASPPAQVAAPATPSASGSSTGGSLLSGSYYYRVTAYNANGETTGSPEVGVTLTARLPAPAGLTTSLQAFGGKIASGSILYYTVTALNAQGETTASSEVAQSAILLNAPTGLSATPATAGGGLGPGTIYYKVTAVNSAGETTPALNAPPVFTPFMLPAYLPAVPVLGRTGETIATIPATLPPPTGLVATNPSTGGSLAAGITLYHKVSALNAQGETTGSSEVSVTTGAGVTNSVALSWNPVPGAASYNVYRATAASGESVTPALLGNTATTGFTDTGQPASSGAIPAVNTAVVTTGQVTLTWSPVAGATGYRVYKGASSGGQSSFFVVGNSTTFVDSGGSTTPGSPPSTNTTAGNNNLFVISWSPVPGAASYNVYRSSTPGGEGAASSLLANTTGTSVTDTGGPTGPGSMPGTNTALASTSSVQLSWAAVPNATGYRVYRGTSPGGEDRYFQTTQTSLTDTGAAATVHSIPSTNGASITTGMVNLAWSAVVGATGYRIYRSATTGGESSSPALLAQVPASVLTYQDVGNAVSSGSVPGSNTAATGDLVYVDRVELVKVEDRQVDAAFNGARDLGQIALYDQRAEPRKITR